MGMRDDNSSLGHFLYPPNDNSLNFNYRDTVNVSWTTFDATILGFLSLWYWPGDGPWLLSLNTSAPLNGSKIVHLAVASKSYMGQFNFNFASDGESDGKYLSEFFNVNHDSSQAPLAWPSDSVSQASSISEQSTTAVATQSSSQLNPSPSSQSDTAPASSTTHASGSLKGGAIAGISVGSFILVSSILALTAILFIRRSRRNGKRIPKSVEVFGQGAERKEPPTEQMALRELPAEHLRELPTEQMEPRELPPADKYLVRTELPN